MRIQAIRASETLYKHGDKSLADDYRAAAKDTDPDVALQALLTLNVLKVADAPAVIQATMAENKARGVQEIGKVLLTPPARGRGSVGMTTEQQDLLQRGETIYTELCFSCHGPDGRGAPMAGAPAGTMMAPPLAGSPRVQGAPRLRRQGAAERVDRAAERTRPTRRSWCRWGRRTTGSRRSAPTCATTSATPAALVSVADVARVRDGRRGPQDDVDGAGAGGVAAGAGAGGRGVEGDRQPQSGRRAGRVDA